ncbi:MAG: LamG domain-containing protein [Labilithrix sp.]|nr:LamG domain-containing protein [Labilithrix sp.]
MAALVLAACSLVDLGGYSDGHLTTTDSGEPDVGADAEALANEDAGPEAEAGPDEHPYIVAVRADAPLSWYRFEEDSDANAARDEMGRHDATLVGGSMGFGAKGIAGRGLACDGTGRGFDVGDTYDFDGQVPFTLELWIAPTSTGGDQHVFHKRKDGNPLLGYILYATPNNTLQFESWGVSLTAWTTSPIPSSDFTHVVLTVAYAGGKGNAKLWINAQPQPNGGFDNTADAPNTDQPLQFLRRFKGAADELAIYDKALTATRILEHYRAGKP